MEKFAGIVTIVNSYFSLQSALFQLFTVVQVIFMMKHTFPHYRLLATLTKIRIMNGLFIKQIRFTVSTRMRSSHCVIYENARRFAQFCTICTILKTPMEQCCFQVSCRLKPATFTNSNFSCLSVFHVFIIVQKVPSRAEQQRSNLTQNLIIPGKTYIRETVLTKCRYAT